MSLFKWSSAHSVYLPEIDAEHRAIYRLGDELHKALLAGAEPAQLKPILANLLESADQHFRHEERLMRAVHYTAFAWHKQQHDAARKRLKQFTERIDAGESGAVCEMVDFFKLWLRDHTGLHDRMMAAYLRNFGRAHAQTAS